MEKFNFDIDYAGHCDTALALLKIPADDGDHDEAGVYPPGKICRDYFYDLWLSDSPTAEHFLSECYLTLKTLAEEREAEE